jgi:hypothetical protein
MLLFISIDFFFKFLLVFIFFKSRLETPVWSPKKQLAPPSVGMKRGSDETWKSGSARG